MRWVSQLADLIADIPASRENQRTKSFRETRLIESILAFVHPGPAAQLPKKLRLTFSQIL